MVVTGFDGMNFSLFVNPRTLKTIQLLLSGVTEPQLKVVHHELRMSGFGYTLDEVRAIVTQARLLLEPFTVPIRVPSPEELGQVSGEQQPANQPN